MSWLKQTQEKMFADILARKTNLDYLENAQRLDVYSHGYYIRIHDVLKSDFSLTFWVLGEKKFSTLTLEYIQSTPSRHYNLNAVGNSFSSFVANHNLSKEYPFLADLIDYERGFIQSQAKVWKNPVDFSKFQHLTMEKWSDAKFSFQPSLLLMQSGWSFQKAYDAMMASRPFSMDLIQRVSAYYMFYQKEDGSYSRVIEKAEYKTIELLMNNSSLGDVFDTLEGEDMIQSVFSWFQQWQEKELITDIHFESHESE